MPALSPSSPATSATATAPTDVNFFLANLVGGRRQVYGVDTSLERSLGARGSATLQYSWKQAKGNSNSDESADLQGDILALDPRQPYMYGWLPGTIEHQVKLFGSARLWRRLEVGWLAYWSSGARYTEADIYRPTGSDIYFNHQLPDGSYVRTGNRKHPAWWTTDLRLATPSRSAGAPSSEASLDVYNLFDDQRAFLVEAGHNDPELAYGADRMLLAPRRSSSACGRRSERERRRLCGWRARYQT